MTKLQENMITKIACSLYQPNNDGKAPKSFAETGSIWTKQIIRTAEDKGVATTLITAGLIKVSTCTKADIERGDESTLWLTEKGFEEFSKL